MLIAAASTKVEHVDPHPPADTLPCCGTLVFAPAY